MEDLKEYLSEIDENAEKLDALADEIWGCAETAYDETKSAAFLTAFFEREGFKVTCPAYGVKTAFTASYTYPHAVLGDSKCIPRIGVLGEYDALSGLSQAAGVVEPCPLEAGKPGHGCGHNLLGVGAAAAALAIKRYLAAGHPGTVVYYGCPAEEGGSGKAFMAKNGAFQDLDAAITWHPDSLNMVVKDSSLANFQVLYSFKGISAHAAGCPELGRSALDAMELMNVGINFLREHMVDQARVHYAILDGGGYSPNVVQNHAQGLYLVRSPKQQEAYDLLQRVDKIAQGAAMMTETTVESRFIKSCANFVSNRTLEKVMYASMQEVPLPEYTEEELAQQRAYSATNPAGWDRQYNAITGELLDPKDSAVMKAHKKDAMFNFVVPYEEMHRVAAAGGSTDVGDVSFQCPTVQLHAATWAPGTPAHSWQVVSQGKSSQAHKAMRYAGKCMALTALKLLAAPALLQEARAEFKETMSEQKYIPIPKDVEPAALSTLH